MTYTPPTFAARPPSITTALARNRLTTPHVLAAVLAAAAPLTVVAGAATTGFAVTDFVGVPVTYAAAAAVLALFAVGYTAMSRHIVNAGAFSAYISHGLGRVAGTAAAFVAVVAYHTLQVSLYGAFGVAAGAVLDPLTGAPPWWVCALAGWAAVALMGVARIEASGRLLVVLLGAEIIIAVVYAAVLVAHPAGGSVSFTAILPSQLGSAAALAILVGGIAGYVGFEQGTVYAEEVRDPYRTVPRATYTALITAGVLYAGCSWAMTVATGPDQIVAQAKQHETALFFTLAGQHLPAWTISVGRLLFATSLFAGLLAFHNTVARYLFALGRERILPRTLGNVLRRTGAPYAGSLLQSAGALAVIAIYAANGWDPITRLFFWLGVTGALGVLILMAFTSLAVARYFAIAPRGETRWRRAVAPWLSMTVLMSITLMTVLSFHVFLDVPGGSLTRWAFPAVYLAATGAGVAWALVLRTYRPDIYRRAGRGADADTTPRPAPSAPLIAPDRSR